MITIDARSTCQPTHGISRYTSSLLWGLSEIAPDASLNVLLDASAPPDALILELRRSSAVRWQWVQVGFGASVIHKNFLELPHLLRHLSTRVFHSPDMTCFPRGPTRHIVTLHDVIPLTHRQHLARSAKAKYAWLWRRWLCLVISRADVVVTVSDFSRQEIHRVLGTPLSKIRRIYNGVLEPQSPDADEVRRQEPLLTSLDPYLLYVGRHNPYKNLTSMIRAFAQFLGLADRRWNFVLVGPTDPRYQEPQRLVETLGLSDRVRFLGYVSDSLLDLLYRRARLLMLPSLAEGFALPIVEAMIRGTPVLTSREGAMGEIARGAAILVDPTSVGSIVEGLRSILLEPGTADRLIQAGLARSGEFTPRRMAQQYLELYMSLM